MKSEWPKRKLGEVCERVTVGHVGITTPHYREDGVLFLRTQNVGVGGLVLDDTKYITPDFHASLKKSEVKPGDILMSRVITHTVNCALIPPDLGPANCANVVLVRPSADLWPEYLAHYIRSGEAQEHLLARKVGSAQLVVNTTVVRDWPVPIPPLKEQKRIVHLLDEAFEGIAVAKANAERNLQSAQAIFLGHLRSIFDQPGANWVTKPVREIAQHSLGKMLDKAKNKGVPQPYLRNLNVRWFTFDLSDLLQMPFLPSEEEKYTAKKDDVLVCEGG